MKVKKRLIKISIVMIVLLLLIANINMSHGVTVAAVGGAIGGAVGVGGLVVVLCELLQVGTIAVASALNGIIMIASGLIPGDRNHGTRREKYRI